MTVSNWTDADSLRTAKSGRSMSSIMTSRKNWDKRLGSTPQAAIFGSESRSKTWSHYETPKESPLRST